MKHCLFVLAYNVLRYVLSTSRSGYYHQVASTLFQVEFSIIIAFIARPVLESIMTFCSLNYFIGILLKMTVGTSVVQTSFILQLYYHRLGTEQSEDVLFAEFPEHAKWMR